MSTDLIAEYYSIREALADELYELNNQINNLVVRRDSIQAVFADEAVPDVTEPPVKLVKKTAAKKTVAKKRTPLNRTVDRKLIIFIKNHGNEGVRRPQINELFGNKLTRNELNNLLKRLRDAGLIASPRATTAPPRGTSPRSNPTIKEHNSMAKQEVLEGIEKTIDTAEDTVHTLERIPKMNLNGTSKSEQKIILFTVAAGGALVGGFLTFAAIKRRLPFRRNKNTVINPPVL